MGICIWNNDVFNYHIRVSNMIKSKIKKEKLTHQKINFSIKIISDFKEKVNGVGKEWKQ